MSLRYAQIFDGGVDLATPPGGGPQNFPVVKEIHKFEATIPNGNLAADTSIGKAIDLEKTWAIVHTRTSSSVADDVMVGYFFPNDSTIRLERWGGVGEITATVQLIEFEEGIRVQRGVFHSPVSWNDEEINIAPVDLDKTFLTLKVAAKNDEFSGFDIVGEMWVRGKFKNDSTIVLDHNENTIGDSPEGVSVYWQVVEFADGVRVWSRDVGGVDLANNFKTEDILDDLGLDRPPRPDQTFMVFSNRFRADASGSSPRVDFWSMDGFLFNGSAGLWRAGGDEGEKKDIHIFIVELEFAYVESYHISSPAAAAGVQHTITQELGAIRDAANTVAFLPWNQWGGFVDAGTSDSSLFWTTAEVVGDQLKVVRENGGAQIVSMEAYVLEFEEPPLTADQGPLFIKNIYSGDEQFVKNIFGNKPTQRDVTLPAAVDQEKCIIWATASGRDNWTDAMVWVEFVDDDTIRLHCPGSDDFTDITWYVWEFESGVRVQRGKFQDADFTEGHAVEFIEPVDPNRTFIVAQWGESSPHGVVWLGGATQVRGFVTPDTISFTPVAWQAVEISNDGEVHHFGKAWQQGDGELVEEVGIGADWDLDSLFTWATDFSAQSGRLQHYDVKGADRKVVITRGNDAGRASSVVEVVDLGTFDILVPQREHHFVSLEEGTEQFDLALNNEYDITKTIAWVPMAGNFLVPVVGGNEAGGGVRLKMIDSSTLRIFREDNAFTDPGDKWEGFVYILGFVPEVVVPPPFEPPPPPQEPPPRQDEPTDSPPTSGPGCIAGIEVVERFECDGVNPIGG